MDEGFLESLLAECGIRRYPPAFLAEYEPFECFAHSDACETLLVKHKGTDLFYVAKCYQKAAASTSEARILKNLSHPGLPRFVGEYENGETLCVVREYVEGTPLHRYVAQRRPDEGRALGLAVSLCDILAYLHGRTPPVIHRDIKPQNLIVDPQGQLWLIDFGISRVFDQSRAEDTVCCGTKDFAAPEQYGYAQTDPRTDIFSLGILLGWLFTGESQREKILPRLSDRRIRRIVEKCTAFAPKERYSSVAKVRADLLALDGRRKKRALWGSCAALACLLCLCAGFALGRYGEVSGMLTPAGSVDFREPLVERAVRLALGVGEGEPIGEKDLLSVTELWIYGDRVAGDSAGYDALCRQVTLGQGPLKNGGMTSLGDVARLKNLRVLKVARQDITDLTALGGLTDLQSLDLRENPVSDLSSLGSLPRLGDVCLFSTRAADLSPLAGCPLLRHLDAGRSLVSSLASLAGLKELQSLGLYEAPLQSLQGLRELTRLEWLSLSGVADGDLTPLLSHPALREVQLDRALRQAAEEVLGQAGLKVEYR